MTQEFSGQLALASTIVRARMGCRATGNITFAVSGPLGMVLFRLLLTGRVQVGYGAIQSSTSYKYESFFFFFFFFFTTEKKGAAVPYSTAGPAPGW